MKRLDLPMAKLGTWSQLMICLHHVHQIPGQTVVLILKNNMFIRSTLIFSRVLKPFLEVEMNERI